MERPIEGERPRVCPDYPSGEHYLFEVRTHVFFDKFVKTKGREPTPEEMAAFVLKEKTVKTPLEMQAIRACPVCVEQIRQANERNEVAFDVPESALGLLGAMGMTRAQLVSNYKYLRGRRG